MPPGATAVESERETGLDEGLDFDDAVLEALSDAGEDGESSDTPDDDESDEPEDDESEDDELEDDDAGDDDELDSPDEDDDDGDELEDDEDAPDDDDDLEETEAERRAREAEEALEQLRAEREAEAAEREAVQRAETIVQALVQIKTAADKYDEDNRLPPGSSWTQISAYLKEGHKDFVIKQQAEQLRQIKEREAFEKDQRIERQAFDHFLTEFDRKKHLNPLEKMLLNMARTPDEFIYIGDAILEYRGDRTRPAREAAGRKRAQRKQSGADRTGVRSSGGARKPTQALDQFKSADPEGMVGEALEEAFA